MPNMRTIFGNTQTFVGLLDLSGVLLEANRPSLYSLGTKSVQLSSKPVWETQGWLDSPIAASKLKEAVEQGARGEFSRFESEHTNLDGRISYFECTITPVYSEKNNVISLVIEGRDTTELKESQKALVESEMRQRLAVDIAGIGIWEWDMVSDQVVWDDKQFELFGLAKVEGPIPLSTTIDAFILTIANV